MFALFLGTVFLQKEIAELLFEGVNRIDDWMHCQICRQSGLLFRFEVMPMTAHERQQSAIPGTGGIEFTPASEEVMIDQPDHMEAVRHDASIGAVLAN